MMKINKSFYFVRDAQTDWMVNNLIMGKTDIPLNSTGIEQAKLLREKVQNLNFNAIYTSPLLRAVETADILDAYLKLQHPVIVVDGLIERNRGLYEGQTNDKSTMQNIHEKNNGNVNEEDAEKFKERVSNAFNTILDNDTNPLIVSHGSIFKLLKKELNITHPEISKNSGIYFFKYSDTAPHWTIEVIYEPQ